MLLLCRYEDEINRRTTAENEFVVLKKVRDANGDTKAEINLISLSMLVLTAGVAVGICSPNLTEMHPALP